MCKTNKDIPFLMLYLKDAKDNDDLYARIEKIICGFTIE